MGYVSMTHYVINVAIDMLTAEEIDFRIFSVIIEIVHLPFAVGNGHIIFDHAVVLETFVT